MFIYFQVKTISKDVAPANLLKKRLWHLYFCVLPKVKDKERCFRCVIYTS